MNGQVKEGGGNGRWGKEVLGWCSCKLPKVNCTYKTKQKKKKRLKKAEFRCNKLYKKIKKKLDNCHYVSVHGFFSFLNSHVLFIG